MSGCFLFNPFIGQRTEPSDLFNLYVELNYDKILSKGCDKLSLNIDGIADVIGIIGGIASFITFLLSRSIFKNISIQKQDYNEQRKYIQTTLMALRQNIWEDNLDNIKIRSQMREALFSYFNKYWSISSPRCIYHLLRSIHYSKKPIKENKKESLCISLDYLIAYLDKKENINNE